MILYPAVTRGRSPTYLYTNENLDAIVKGLDVNETDDVLTLLGSGDQAFALLEYANSVLAVDIEEDAVKYAQYRLEALKAGDIGEFLKPRRFCDLNCSVPLDKERSNIYFMRGNRMEKIREKAGRLQIIHKSIYEVNDLERFSKAYVSNALGYELSQASIKQAENFLEELAQKLKIPGMAYIASKYNPCPPKSVFFNAGADAIKWPNMFCIDERLTEEATALEKSFITWKPLVLRRRA